MNSPIRTRRCTEMGERLRKALLEGFVSRGLPFGVTQVEFREDGTASVRLEMDLDYDGRPMKPEAIADGMLGLVMGATRGLDGDHEPPAPKRRARR